MNEHLWDLIVKIEGPPGAVSGADSAMTELVSFDLQKSPTRGIERVPNSDSVFGLSPTNPAVSSPLNQDS